MPWRDAGDASSQPRARRHRPDFEGLERTYLQSHFAWVLCVLRAQRHRDWSAQKLLARERTLVALALYLERARFPRNTSDRPLAPCFVDDRGNPCAVAHLMLETGEDDLVSTISRQQNLAWLSALAAPGLDEWLESAGLTAAEARLIQPCYYGGMSSDPCQEWDPVACRYGPVRDEKPCGTDNFCTAAICLSGSCTTIVTNCDDSNAATIDRCIPEVGCTHVAGLGDDPNGLANATATTSAGGAGTGDGGAAATEPDGGCSIGAHWEVASPAPMLAAVFLLTWAGCAGRLRSRRL